MSHHHAPYGKETVTLVVVVGYASHPIDHDMAVWPNQLSWDGISASRLLSDVCDAVSGADGAKALNNGLSINMC